MGGCQEQGRGKGLGEIDREIILQVRRVENAGVPVLQLAVMRKKNRHSILCRQWTVGDLVTLTIEWVS